MATLQTGVVPAAPTSITEVYTVEETTTLELQAPPPPPPPETTQNNYVKIIRSIGPTSVVDILPSVVEYIVQNDDKVSVTIHIVITLHFIVSLELCLSFTASYL